MFRFFRHDTPNHQVVSKLFDQNDFYKNFSSDIRSATDNIFIESPFITTTRITKLLPLLSSGVKRGVKIVVNTRHPSEHDEPYPSQAWQAIKALQLLGIEVLFTGGLHRKIAIIDQTTLWEGSLNILSQNDSCELMRRTVSTSYVDILVNYLKIGCYLR